MQNFKKWLKALGYFLGRLWLLFGLVLLGLLLLEGAASLWQSRHHSDSSVDRRLSHVLYQDCDWAREYFEDYRQLEFEWHPYNTNRRQAFKSKHININQQGVRKTWQPESQDQNSPTVWVFGGSSVWGVGVRDEGTLPSALAKVAHEKGLPLNVINFGESGWTSTQSVIELLRRLQAGERPDSVVFVDGVNDTMSALDNQQAGVTFGEPLRQREFNLTSSLKDEELKQFALKRVLADSALRRLLQSPPSPRQKVAPPELAGDVVSTYLSNRQVVRALGKEFGFEVYFFWQPTVFDKHQRHSDEERSRIDHAHREKIHLDVLNKLKSQSTEVVFLQAVVASLPQPLFVDFCHLHEEGNKLLAQKIFSRLSVARP